MNHANENNLLVLESGRYIKDTNIKESVTATWVRGNNWCYWLSGCVVSLSKSFINEWVNYDCVCVNWWPFYWYSQAKCHYLYIKIGATIFWSWVCSISSRLQTCKKISVAGYGIEVGMTSLYLSILGMLSLSPHQTPQQTAKHQQLIIISDGPLCSICIRTGTCFVLSLKHICRIYLMYSKSKSNSLDNELLFFRTTTNCLKLSRDSLHVLHG